MGSTIKEVWFDIALSLAIIFAIVSHYLNLLPSQVGSYFLIVVAILGTLTVLVIAVRQIFKKEISMDLLASIALVFSLLSKEWVGASFIALMIAAARILKTITENQAKRSIKSLLKLRPNKAKVIKNNNVLEIPIEKLKIGDVVVIDLGDRVPVDGKSISGNFSVDESSLTGESMPVDKNIGDKVFGSTIVVSGSAHILVEKIGKDTTLEKIIGLLESSGKLKPHFQTVGERFGKIYLIGIFIVSFLVLLITHNTKLVLSILLVICADDVAVAIPLAYLSATRRAAKMGVIVKGSSYLEVLGKVDTVVFDKTGTLTTGHMQVSEIKSFSQYSEKELLMYCGSLMEQSSHPISKTIYAYAKKEKIHLELVEKVEEIGGMGLIGEYENKKILFGRKAFLLSHHIKINDRVSTEISRLENEGRSNSFMVVNNELAGIISLTDEIRRGSKEAIAHIKKLGVKNVVMLTGDNEKAAGRVAKELGIEFHAELLPEQKVSFIKNYLDTKKTVAMVGDGVNDAAAMRMATVGIAMGAIGYDTAIESADIVLMKDDIAKIADIIKLARFTGRLSAQDFGIWGFSNVFGLAFVFLGIIGPSGAAAYNFITDFFPLFNSLRANKK
jgi:heavy metal translocating P-type ATPase